MTTTTQRLVDYYQWVIENGGKYLHRQTAHFTPCKDKLTISSSSYPGSCPTPRSAAPVGVDPGNEVDRPFIRSSQITFYGILQPRSIRAPCYYRQFALSLGKESPFIFFKSNPRSTRKLSMTPSVFILTGFDSCTW